MTEKQMKIFLAVSAVAVGLTYKNYLTVRAQERAKRAEIQTQTRVDIEAIWRAAARMHEKLETGEYRVQSVEKLREDFEFEIIAAHYE